MADDAPAGAGTDETTGQGQARPSNGDAAGRGLPSAATGGPVPTGQAPVTSNGMIENDTAAVGGIDPTATVPTTSPARPAPASTPTAVPPAGAGTGPDPQPNGPALNGDPTSVVGFAAPSGSGSDTESHAASVAGRADVPVAEAGARSPRWSRRARAGKPRSFWRELPVLVVIAVGLAVLIRSFLVQAFFIPSGSMETTLHGCPGCSGDRVLVNKVVYDIHDPRPGDVVVFRGPPSWDAEVPVSEPGNVVARALHWVGQTVGVSQPDEKDFVKRVIAVGGQTVACCDPQGRVTVDGVPLDEPYIYLSNSDSQSQPFGPVTVPEGRLWVMGDHRDGSADSRAHLDDGTSGTVPVSDVIGKAFVIVWPPSRWNILDTPTTFHGMSLGELSVGMPMALGVVGPLPVAAFRRRRRRGSGD